MKVTLGALFPVAISLWPDLHISKYSGCRNKAIIGTPVSKYAASRLIQKTDIRVNL
jgi:hypothetical protein